MKKIQTNKRTLFLSNMPSVVEEKTLDGKDYWVAPVILCRECVMNRLLYPESELSDNPQIWNGVPLVINHPTDDNGKPVSANSPDVIEKQGVGYLFNCFYDYELKALKGEAWIDKAKVESKFPELRQKMENNEKIEVSTGLFSDYKQESGLFNNKAYDAVAVNYVPDHLAILPWDKGACSWEDGAGLLRTNKDKENRKMNLSEIFKLIANKLGISGELSLRDKEDNIETALSEKYGKDVFVVDVFDNYAVYRVWEDNGAMGKYYKQDYAITSEGKIELIGEPVEVQRITQYQEIINNILSSARTPSFDGIETSDWGNVKKTFEAYRDGYYKFKGNKPENSEDIPSQVQDAPADMKSWIASKTLLGDAKADSEADLIFFPVVNPKTNALNKNALNAVISGRGSQAKISESAKTSAQNKARSLLEKYFQPKKSLKTQKEENTMEKEKMVNELVANKLYKWTEDDKEFLNGLDEEKLEKLLVNVEVKEPEKKEEKPEKNELKEPVANKQEEEWMKFGKQLFVNRKKELIKKIKKLETNKFSEDELEKMDFNLLEKMAESIAPQVDYSGASGSVSGITTNEEKDELGEGLGVPGFVNKK